MRTLALTLSWGLLLTSAALAQANPAPVPSIKPDGPAWTAEPAFSFEVDSKKTRRAMSGIACTAPGQGGTRQCLAAFDEGAEARQFSLGDGRYAAAPDHLVLSSGEEVDAEGAAIDGGFYYVTGSHGVIRKTCEDNPTSHLVVRFPVDASTDKVATTNGKAVGETAKGNLTQIMKSFPALEPYVGPDKCLGTERPEKRLDLVGKQGVNIEGLAIHNGRLYFGFRGPSLNGTVPILSVDRDAFFAGIDPKPALSWVKVEVGRGMRDLHAARDGILVLIGPDDDKKNAKFPSVVARWDGAETKSTPESPATLKSLAALDFATFQRRPCDDDEDLKPEALVVLKDEPGQPYRVLVGSDGLCDGGLMTFNIPR